MVTTVPIAGLQKGWNGYTATAPFDYTRWANPASVQVKGPGGWRPLEPGETIPSGAQFRVYTDTKGQLTGTPPPSPGTQSPNAVETTTGQDLAWQNHQIAMDLLAAQDRLRGLEQEDVRLQQEAERFNAQQEQLHQQAMAQFELDAARIGIEAAQVQLNARLADIEAEANAARLNFDQRRAVVDAQLEDARINLQAAQTRAMEERLASQFNFDQRATKAELEQNIMRMLADRSGPQDWTKYNDLLNNLNRANPIASTTIDPFSLLSNLVQEYTPDLTGLEGTHVTDTSGLYQPYTPSPVNSGGFNIDSLLPGVPQNPMTGAHTVNVPTGTAQTVTPPPAPAPEPAPAPAPAPAPSGGGIASGPSKDTVLPPALGGGQEGYATAPTLNPNPTPATPDDDPIEWWTKNHPGMPIPTWMTDGNYNIDPSWYGTQNTGGLLQSGITIVGDTPSGKRTGYEEALVPLPDGRTLVLDRNQTKSLLDGVDLGDVPDRKATGGFVQDLTTRQNNLLANWNAPRQDPGFSRDINRGGAAAATSTNFGVQQPAWNREPNTGIAGNQRTAVNTVRAQPPRGNVDPGFSRGVNEPVWNRPTGAGLDSLRNASRADAARGAIVDPGFSREPVWNRPTTPVNPADFAMVQKPATPPIGTAGKADMVMPSINAVARELVQRQPRERPSTMSLLQSFISSIGRMNEGGIYRMAGGGIVSQTGGDDYDPGKITYNLYDDETLYNQPFLRKIRGQDDSRSFGAFGGGNMVGKWGLPTNLSLQRYGALLPTEQAMLQGAYDDPASGVSFDDILGMAQRASAGTRGYGGMSMYGG